MKKGFTIVEVSILFVIFLIVTFLVAPLSLDDTKQAKNTSKWRSVQADFVNISYSIDMQEDINYEKNFEDIVDNEIKNEIEPYKILFMNGTYPSKTHIYKKYYKTYSNAVLAYKFFEEPQDDIIGTLMYDVNGKEPPNVWGKDVFGLNIYKDRFEPYGSLNSITEQKQDCSRNGTGLFCSHYYLIGGNFD